MGQEVELVLVRLRWRSHAFQRRNCSQGLVYWGLERHVMRVQEALLGSEECLLLLLELVGLERILLLVELLEAVWSELVVRVHHSEWLQALQLLILNKLNLLVLLGDKHVPDLLSLDELLVESGLIL